MTIGCVLLLIGSSAVANRRDKSITYARTSVIVLIFCILISINNFNYNFQENGLGLFHGSFDSTALCHAFQVFIFSVAAMILVLNAFYPRKLWTEEFSWLYRVVVYKFIYYNDLILNKMSPQFKVLEYPLIILFIIIGAVFLMSCCDLISVFLAVELQSYGLYILCTVYRDSEKATSAGLTYFLLGGLSSCFILLASGLIYSNSGNTSFDSIYIIDSILLASGSSNDTSLFSYGSHFVNFSLVIMSIGFLFKISAAPFHFWSPDVYDAIPTVVTTFVAVFAKIAILVLLLELMYYTNTSDYHKDNFDGITDGFKFSWTFTLLISSLLSLIIGSILGLTQYRIKKLYAYSTISHIGFILLALCVNTIESIQSFIFYLMQYTLSNLNAFIILITVGFSLYAYVEEKNHKDKTGSSLSAKISDNDNSPLQIVNQLKGYFHINPVLAISLIVTLFSFVGIPPLIGFFAKQMVLSSALDNGYVFMTFIAILASVISAYYYLALVKQMFFNTSDYKLNPHLEDLAVKVNMVNRINNNVLESIYLGSRNITLSGSLVLVISFLTLIILLFILNPQEWLSMANVLALILFYK